MKSSQEQCAQPVICMETTRPSGSHAGAAFLRFCISNKPWGCSCYWPTMHSKALGHTRVEKKYSPPSKRANDSTEAHLTPGEDHCLNKEAVQRDRRMWGKPTRRASSGGSQGQEEMGRTSLCRAGLIQLTFRW